MSLLLVTINDAQISDPTVDHSFLVKYQAAGTTEQIQQTAYSNRWETGASAWKKSLMQFNLGNNWPAEQIMVQVISATGGGTTVGFGNLALRDLSTNPQQDRWIDIHQQKVLVTLQYLGAPVAVQPKVAPPQLPAATTTATTAATYVPATALLTTAASTIPMAAATIAPASATLHDPPPIYTRSHSVHVPAPTPAPAPAPAAEPTTFDGKYRDLKQLGKGNFGTVYRAKSDVDDQVYAIKLIKIKDESSKKAIREEAKVLFSLYNSHIVRYFTSFLHGAHDDQHYAMVMEFCDGGTLEEQVKGAARAGKQLTDTDITLWTYQISVALEYLHRKGMMHRDLKCDNVMLREGVAKLADFGLASTRQTITGQVGALAYESPEQARHEEYDGRNDVWALGCVVTELITLKFVWKRIKQREVFATNRACVKQTLAEVNQRSSAWANFANWLLTYEKLGRPKSKQVLDYLTPAETEVRQLLSAGQPATSFKFRDRAASKPKALSLPTQLSMHALSSSSLPPAPPKPQHPSPDYHLPPNWEETLSLKLMMLYSEIDPSQTDTIAGTLKNLREGRLAFSELQTHLQSRYNRTIEVPNIAGRVVISPSLHHSSSPALKTMDITIPAGAMPGMDLKVMSPDGKKFIIKIPAGYMPGQRLAVQYKA